MQNRSANNRRILVINDSQRVRDDFRAMLSSCEDDESPGQDEAFEVNVACDGQAGFELVQLALAERQPYAVAFVAMRLPDGWSGVETVERMWQLDPTLQVVLCTAAADALGREVMGCLGQTDRLLILKMPYEVAEIAQLATALTHKWNMQRQLEHQLEEMSEAVAARTGELQEARDYSEQLLGAIASLLVEVDSEFKVRRWNQLAQDLFGLTADQAVGVHFAELPIDWVDVDHVRSMVCRTGTDADRRTEIEFRDGEGRHRVIGVSTYRVGSDGVFNGALVLGTDLTDKRQLEQQLQAAQKLEAVGQLAAGVAHEINTPMQYIGDNVEYLRSCFKQVLKPIEICLQLVNPELESAEQQELLESLAASFKPKKLASILKQVPGAFEDSIEGVRTVSTIVRAMKEFSHPGSEDRTPVNLNDALETTLTVARNEWKYVAEVDLDLEPELPQVPAFPGELNQVFLNLIVNAAHAITDRFGEDSMERGRIGVSTQNCDGEVEVRISDTGCGIPAAIQDRIFDPFFTTKDVGRGTGQGLAIAYNAIVQKHGGKLWFETQEGVGTTFVVCLPLECDSADSTADESPVPVGAV